MKTNFIFVTGGVYSSLGKGITASSIGRILKQFGFSVTMQKLDPYLNVDPEFISPLQHGEVFITSDGAKADLDLGNYERFIDHNLNKYSTITSGRIYSEVLKNERSGFYDGKTVQVIPHITNAIISKINLLAETNMTDFAIVEIGGTVGDIESLPFIHAIKEFKYLNKDHVLFAHCVPLISVASVVGELKTKPAQHSVEKLRSLGIDPDFLLLRSSTKIDSETRNKISWSCSISDDCIFECMDLESTYYLPDKLYEQKIYEPIFRHFKIDKYKDNFSEWTNFTNTIRSKKTKTITVGIIGENIELPDAYFSAKASLYLSAYKLGIDLNINWIQIKNINLNKFFDEYKQNDVFLITPCQDEDNNKIMQKLLKLLEKLDFPVLVYGSAFENVIVNNIENLPLEIYGESSENVFIKQINENVGSRKSKIYDLVLQREYKKDEIEERHFHLYEFNKKYLSLLSKQIDTIGFNTNGDNLDLIKLKNHNFYYASYANIEFTSKPNKPNPLFLNLLKTRL